MTHYLSIHSLHGNDKYEKTKAKKIALLYNTTPITGIVMKKIITTTATAVSLALCSLISQAAEFKPAVAYDSAGKFDK